MKLKILLALIPLVLSGCTSKEEGVSQEQAAAFENYLKQQQPAFAVRNTAPQKRSSSVEISSVVYAPQPQKAASIPTQKLTSKPTVQNVVDAMKNNDLSLFQSLLAQGINPNSIFNKKTKWTLLHLAVHDEKEQFVKILLQNGAKPNVFDYDREFSPLSIAVNHNNRKIVKLLLQYKANPNTCFSKTPCLLDAIISHEKQAFPLVQLLLQYGADPNKSSTGKDSTSPLVMASLTQAPQIVRLLLQAGADPNFVPGEYPAIYWCAETNNMEIAKLLLQAGADPNIPRYDGTTALEMANQEGYVALANLLKRYGARE